MTQTICKLVRLTFISILTKQLQFQKKEKKKQHEIISLVYEKKSL